jgi:hypothetical protein
MTYTVTAPLVIVRPTDDDGRIAGPDVYVYEGGTLPDFVKGDNLQSLLDSKMVEESKAADTGDGPPAKSANKPEWEAYAVSQGMSEEDAHAATKDDLVEKFGG